LFFFNHIISPSYSTYTNTSGKHCTNIIPKQSTSSVVSFVDEDIKNILELNHLLSGGTHGPAGKYSFDQLLQVKTRVEQGIVFLCEIAVTT
jgi:hypothetical protein